MSALENERDQQHMLHLVESAQRDGCSEVEIDELITNAREADAELETRRGLRPARRPRRTAHSSGMTPEGRADA